MSIFNQKTSSNLNNKAESLIRRSDIIQALDYIRELEPETLELQKKMVLVEAPTFHEKARGDYLCGLFSELGLCSIEKDGIGNVYGVYPGRKGPVSIDSGVGCIVIEAHMDTVFPFGTVDTVTEKDSLIYCPGISDNTRGLALLCSLIRCFMHFNIEVDYSIVFLATVREEGLGNLGGIKYFIDKHPEIEACITVDGADSDYVIYGGPGIRTWKLHYYSEGGHAYKHYGAVGNPVHAAIKAMEKLIKIKLPKDPKTTFEITGFHAGTSEGIGAIPAEADLILNFRSESEEELKKLIHAIEFAAREGANAENEFVGCTSVGYEIEVLGEAPVSTQSIDSYMVTSMATVIKCLDMEPILDGNCPTNASITIAKKIPGICIGGGGRAGANHSVSEWFDTKDSYLGVQAAFLELMLLAND